MSKKIEELLSPTRAEEFPATCRLIGSIWDPDGSRHTGEYADVSLAISAVSLAARDVPESLLGERPVMCRFATTRYIDPTSELHREIEAGVVELLSDSSAMNQVLTSGCRGTIFDGEMEGGALAYLVLEVQRTITTHDGSLSLYERDDLVAALCGDDQIWARAVDASIQRVEQQLAKQTSMLHMDLGYLTLDTSDGASEIIQSRLDQWGRAVFSEGMPTVNEDDWNRFLKATTEGDVRTACSIMAPVVIMSEVTQESVEAEVIAQIGLFLQGVRGEVDKYLDEHIAAGLGLTPRQLTREEFASFSSLDGSVEAFLGGPDLTEKEEAVGYVAQKVLLAVLGKYTSSEDIVAVDGARFGSFADTNLKIDMLVTGADGSTRSFDVKTSIKGVIFALGSSLGVSNNSPIERHCAAIEGEMRHCGLEVRDRDGNELTMVDALELAYRDPDIERQVEEVAGQLMSQGILLRETPIGPVCLIRPQPVVMRPGFLMDSIERIEQTLGITIDLSKNPEGRRILDELTVAATEVLEGSFATTGSSALPVETAFCQRLLAVIDEIQGGSPAVRNRASKELISILCESGLRRFPSSSEHYQVLNKTRDSLVNDRKIPPVFIEFFEDLGILNFNEEGASVSLPIRRFSRASFEGFSSSAKLANHQIAAEGSVFAEKFPNLAEKIRNNPEKILGTLIHSPELQSAIASSFSPDPSVPLTHRVAHPSHTRQSLNEELGSSGVVLILEQYGLLTFNSEGTRIVFPNGHGSVPERREPANSDSESDRRWPSRPVLVRDKGNSSRQSFQKPVLKNKQGAEK